MSVGLYPDPVNFQNLFWPELLHRDIPHSILFEDVPHMEMLVPFDNI
jgi:hypothetical protein